MIFPKIVETIPIEKRKILSDKLVDAVLVSKNDEKMPRNLANNILYNWQLGLLAGDEGLLVLLEAALLLEPDKTMEILEGELRLMDTAKVVREGIIEAGK